MLYFIMENGSGAYVEAQDGDPIYNPKTCILVPKRPTDGGYVIDLKTKTWVLTMESQKNYIRTLRNPELTRTDKYVLPDYPISEKHLAGAITYREELREAPDKSTPEEMKMPVCPIYLNPIP